MDKTIMKLAEATKLIEQGRTLLIAGDEILLASLPKGNWIGGSTPYFMSSDGCLVSKDVLSVVDITDFTKSVCIANYDIASIKNVYRNSSADGFSVIIIPAFSDVHVSFAINAPDYPDFGIAPLVGWVSGHLLSDVSAKSKTFNGLKGHVSTDEAVVMHVDLVKGKYAELQMINLFKPGTGDSIEFLQTGFTAEKAIVNGKEVNFPNYVMSQRLDTRLPLVADYNTQMINTSIKEAGSGRVVFYAPVFKGMTYHLASPVDNYIESFKDAVDKQYLFPAYACNCILNFIYSELEGKNISNIAGPITFGEIGYMLHNQTLVALSINDL